MPPDIAQAFGYAKAMPVRATPAPTPSAPPKPAAGPADGAVQILAVLQRDSRLIDFLMEDLSAYSDDQIGAAARDVQMQGRDSLLRYLRLEPVIDGVEGTFTKTEGLNASEIKLVGNVPASGKAPGGVLRHRGWRAAKVDLPQASPGTVVLAAAELEIE